MLNGTAYGRHAGFPALPFASDGRVTQVRARNNQLQSLDSDLGLNTLKGLQGRVGKLKSGKLLTRSVLSGEQHSSWKGSVSAIARRPGPVARACNPHLTAYNRNNQLPDRRTP